MSNFEKIATKVLGFLNPDKSTGRTLMLLNALSIGFAAASNTFAAAVDKNTSPEDKKFLVPAGGITGLANLGIYFGMTNKLVKCLEGPIADKVTDKLRANEKALKEASKSGSNIGKIGMTYTKAAENFINKTILKASKKHPQEYVDNMKSILKDANGKITAEGRVLFEKNIAKGLGVVGAFIGAVVGCAIITPILRDVSAYCVQKWRERKNPALQNKPYMPYFDPTHIGPKYSKYKLNKQPLSMTSYMNFTHGRTRV